MEFRTLTARIAKALGVDPPPGRGSAAAGASSPGDGGADAGRARPRRAGAAADRPSRYTIIRDAATLAAWVERINELGVVAVDTETTALDEMVAELVGVSLASGRARPPICRSATAPATATCSARRRGRRARWSRRRRWRC
jgi:DNA polymerase I